MMTKQTKLTDRRRAVLAAVMGFTNTGQPNPSRKEVERLFANADWRLQRWPDTKAIELCESSMTSLCQHLCENDEMHEMFLEEARWWFKDKQNLRNATEESVAKIWPDIAALCKEGEIK
jgi:hypothetical protein